MFEKCGLYDILYRIWRKKWFIVVCTAVFMVLGPILSLHGGAGGSNKSGADTDWLISACYLVSADTDGASASESYGEESIYMAKTYATILRTDFSREAVLNRLQQKYSEQEIIKGLRLNVLPDQLDGLNVQTIATVNVLSETAIINIFFYADSQEMAQECMSAYDEIIATLPDVVEGSRVQYLNGVSQIDQNTRDDISGSDSRAGVKRVAIMGIVGLMLSLIFEAACAIFVPTINRKSDFSMYGLDMLGEVTDGTNRKGDIQ